MVRDSGRRTSKYAAKLVGDVIKNRIDAQKDSMVEQVTDQFAVFATAETQCKTYLEGVGVGTIFVPFYMSFARQCVSINQKHKDSIGVTEMCIRHASWVTRGLDGFYMQEIAQLVTGVDISSCTA